VVHVAPQRPAQQARGAPASPSMKL
jgi:hypothetical protein